MSDTAGIDRLVYGVLLAASAVVGIEGAAPLIGGVPAATQQAIAFVALCVVVWGVYLAATAAPVVRTLVRAGAAAREVGR